MISAGSCAEPDVDILVIDEEGSIEEAATILNERFHEISAV